jgi:hypothetical protein
VTTELHDVLSSKDKLPSALIEATSDQSSGRMHSWKNTTNPVPEKEKINAEHSLKDKQCPIESRRFRSRSPRIPIFPQLCPPGCVAAGYP